MELVSSLSPENIFLVCSKSVQLHQIIVIYDQKVEYIHSIPTIFAQSYISACNIVSVIFLSHLTSYYHELQSIEYFL